MRRSLLRSPWRLPLLLAAVCGVLAAVIATEYGVLMGTGTAEEEDSEPALAAGNETTPAVRPQAGGAVFRPGPLDSFADIVERPLFQASRRPIAKAGSEDSLPQAAIDTSMQLAGVVLSGGHRAALLQMEGSPRPVHVEVGSEVGGWKVESIAAERVVLRQGEKTREITLDERMKAVAAMGGGASRPPGKKPQGQPERGGAKPGQQPGKMPAQVPAKAAQPPQASQPQQPSAKSAPPPPRGAGQMQRLDAAPALDEAPQPFEGSLR